MEEKQAIIIVALLLAAYLLVIILSFLSAVRKRYKEEIKPAVKQLFQELMATIATMYRGKEMETAFVYFVMGLVISLVVCLTYF